MFKLDLEKAEAPEVKLPTSAGSLEKQEVPENIYFCFIDNAMSFDCEDHNKLWQILQEMGIPDHLTCLLRNLYAGQERKKGSEVVQSCLTLCDLMDCCCLPGSSVHGIFQARVLEWVAISFSWGSSQSRDRTWVSHIVGRRFTV